MSCSNCQYRWCWVCGLSLSHWSHKLSEVLPFSCKMVPTTSYGWLFYFLLFILGFGLIPLIIFILSLFATIYVCMACPFRLRFVTSYKLKRCDRNQCCRFFSFIPLFILLFALGVCFGAIGAGILTALLTIPFLVFHTYYFMRTVYWWFKSSRVKE
jgi:hypothetical protein